jgi:hypothetical protein
MAGWLDDSEPRVEAEFRGGRERGGDMLTKLSKDGRAYRLGGRES